jgi:hypothetical protein
MIQKVLGSSFSDAKTKDPPLLAAIDATAQALVITMLFFKV